MKQSHPSATDSLKLDTLYSIGKVISQKLDAEFIVRTVIEATTQVSVADVGICCYWVNGTDGPPLYTVAVGGRATELEAFHGFHKLRKLLHRFTDKQIVRLDAAYESSEIDVLFSDFVEPESPPIVHSLVAPIYTVTAELTGIVLLGFCRTDTYNEVDEDLLYSISSQMTVALENARLFEEVNALNQKKNEFIALASHELKTPLATVKGYLQILERYEINQIGQRFLAKALTQIDRIESLIGELLDISRIEANKLDLNFETFDIADLVADVVETFHFSSLTHHIVVSDAPTISVQADRQRIEQVVINFLSNAIKYSPESDTVHVSLETSDTCVTINVTDEGIGMSPEQQAKIFSRFSRVAGTSKIPGLGLGLYLSKQIIDRHGGRIGVQSEIGKGSTFFFSIPRFKAGDGWTRTLFD